MQNNSKTIRIVGASSAIAQDFLRVANRSRCDHIFHLYSRDLGFLDSLTLNELKIYSHPFDDFMNADECDVILNFVGLGTPLRIAHESQGLALLDQTVDSACLRLLQLNRSATYIYVSSGASYGSDFSQPARDSNELPGRAKFDLPRDLYGWVKRSTEARHRLLTDFKIINLRVFGYVSENLDPNAGFLLSDLARSIQTGSPAQIDVEETRRDFLNPERFFQTVSFCIEHALPNTSLDLVSATPLEKSELVEALADNFGLEVRWVSRELSSHSVLKSNYFSLSKRLDDFGLPAVATALEVVMKEFKSLFGSHLK